MNIRILSCILIIVSSVCLGYTLSNAFSKRLRFLEDFKRTVEYTQNIISYKNEPFADVVHEVYKNTKNDVAELYFLVCNMINRSYDFYNREFKTEMKKFLSDKALTKDDIAVISDYFSDIGFLDKQHQLKSINDINNRLTLLINDAKKAKDENFKTYISFSALGGVFICIIMI